MTLNQEFIDRLKLLARRKMWSEDEDEDFNPYDMSGGNFDDCYEGGRRDGEVDMAREILTELGIDWE